MAVVTAATGMAATGAGMLARARRVVPRATLLLSCKSAVVLGLRAVWYLESSC